MEYFIIRQHPSSELSWAVQFCAILPWNDRLFVIRRCDAVTALRFTAIIRVINIESLAVGISESEGDRYIDEWKKGRWNNLLSFAWSAAMRVGRRSGWADMRTTLACAAWCAMRETNSEKKRKSVDLILFNYQLNCKNGLGAGDNRNVDVPPLIRLASMLFKSGDQSSQTTTGNIIYFISYHICGEFTFFSDAIVFFFCSWPNWFAQSWCARAIVASFSFQLLVIYFVVSNEREIHKIEIEQDSNQFCTRTVSTECQWFVWWRNNQRMQSVKSLRAQRWKIVIVASAPWQFENKKKTRSQL